MLRQGRGGFGVAFRSRPASRIADALSVPCAGFSCWSAWLRWTLHSVPSLHSTSPMMHQLLIGQAPHGLGPRQLYAGPVWSAPSDQWSRLAPSPDPSNAMPLTRNRVKRRVIRRNTCYRSIVRTIEINRSFWPGIICRVYHHRMIVPRICSRSAFVPRVLKLVCHQRCT